MITDAIKAITQLFSPQLRAVLWKSIGLALALIVVVGIVLERLIVHFVDVGGASVESTLGTQSLVPVGVLPCLLLFGAALALIVGGVLLMPAVPALVGSFFADQIGGEVERELYPADPPGKAAPLWLATWEGVKTALLALL